MYDRINNEVGRIMEYNCVGVSNFSVNGICPSCHGEGNITVPVNEVDYKTKKEVCKNCNGSGIIKLGIEVKRG
jgi:DnaJ-class molecular chaperone